MKKPKNYINNRTLYQSIIEYKNSIEEAQREGLSKPQVTRYIGESLLLICTNLSKKGNFSGYTYRDEMVSDGIIDCLAAIENFNPDKTNNPFAYFSQIAWNAFIRRIQKEKKQSYIKHKNYENMCLVTDTDGIVGEKLKNNEFVNDVVDSFEKKLTKVKKKSKIGRLEKFQEEKEDV